MKTISKYLLLILFLNSFLCQGQLIPKKKTSKSVDMVSIKTKIPTLKKASLNQLQFAKTGVINPKPLNVSKEVLMLPSSKKYRITPKKPFDNGLSFSFYGNYSVQAFTVSPRLSGNTNNSHSKNQYYTYSGFILFNAKINKEYRVKIDLAEVRGSGKILINDQISSVSSTNRTINYVFGTSSNGQHVITISPYERNGAINPEGFKITSIQIDEL